MMALGKIIVLWYLGYNYGNLDPVLVLLQSAAPQQSCLRFWRAARIGSTEHMLKQTNKQKDPPENVTEEADYLWSMLITQSCSPPCSTQNYSSHFWGPGDAVLSLRTFSTLHTPQHQSTEDELLYWPSKISFCLLLRLEIAEGQESGRRNH